jgi:hypothetical protein
MQLHLTGYITDADNKLITLMGVPESAWACLHSSYWESDVCRRVSKNKKKCVIRVTDNTKFVKKNKIERPKDMVGCYVKVTAIPKKYEFITHPGVTKKGWTITALNVCTIPIIVSHV